MGLCPFIQGLVCPLEVFNADGKYTSMQTPSSCANRLRQEIPYAQDSQDTWRSVYRRISR